MSSRAQRSSHSLQESQEPRDDLIWFLEALGRIKVLNEADPEFAKRAISGMILDSPRWWVKGFTVDLQDSPFAFAADQEVGLTILPSRRQPEPAATVGKEEHTCTVEGFCYADLALGAKVEIVPDSEGPPLGSLVVYPHAARNLEELVAPGRVDGDVLDMDGKVLEVGLLGQDGFKGASDGSSRWVA